MKYSVLLFICGSVIISCNTDRCHAVNEVFDEEDYKSSNVMLDKFGKRATEVFVNIRDSNRILIKTYWENDNVQSLTFYRKNLKSGPMTIYDYDGKPQFEGFYLDDKLNGTSFLYNNGKVSSIDFYYKGIQRGLDSTISTKLLSIINE